MAFSNPEHNIAQLNLLHGAHVADLGAGSGHYTLAAAKAVGQLGKVYCVEVQKELLSKVKNDAQREHLTNVEVVWADIEKKGGTKLGDGAMDAVIISNVLFQAEDKPGLVAEAARILKSGGKALVIDWSDMKGIGGPNPAHLVTKETALSYFQKTGLHHDADISAGDHHYGFIMKKS